MMPIGNQKLIPRFHALNLVAKDAGGQGHLFMFTTVAMNVQEAYIAGLERMKETMPDLYMIGQTNNGFHIATHQEITLSAIQSQFRKVIDEVNPQPEQEAPQIIMPKIEEIKQGETEHNKMIRELIEAGDMRKVARNKKLNEFEKQYIKDRINQAKNANT